MRLTDRDISLVREIALHTVLNRDQIIELGFFDSIPRANARLGGLVKLGLIQRLKLEPYLSPVQSVYFTRCKARAFLEERLANLLASRKPSPLFVQHSLAVAQVRICLTRRWSIQWYHECQIRHRYSDTFGRTEDFRPDGLAIVNGNYHFVEVDRGHVSLPRLKAKINGYARYLSSGTFERTYTASAFNLIFVTTGRQRAARIESIGKACSVPLSIELFSSIDWHRAVPR